MARSIGSNFLSQLNSSQLRTFYAVKMRFTSGDLLLSTTYSNIVIDSETYIGSGNILNISQISETSDTKASGIQINLTGLDSSILSAGLNDNVAGMIVELYFGVLTTTANADAVVDTPYKIFEGFIDTMVLDEQGMSSSLKFTVENKMIILEKPSDRRYTDEDQKELFPNDRGLEFVASLQNKSIAWGGGSK
jgi:hypothetical protein